MVSSASGLRDRSARTTLQFWDRSFCVRARQMPEPAPVMRAVFEERFISLLLHFLCIGKMR